MNPCFSQDMYILKINSLVKKNEFRKKLQLQPYCAEPTICGYNNGLSSLTLGYLYYNELLRIGANEKTCFLHICKNKGMDQLCGYSAADQLLCFRCIDSTIPPLPKSKISSL